MNRYTTLFLGLMSTLSLFGQSTPSLKDLYDEIDEAIKHSPEYVADYEARVKTLTQRYKEARTAEEQLPISLQLFEMYRAFNNDSALAYIQRHIDISEQLGLKQQADHGRALQAFQCSTVGYYTESLDILRSIDSKSLPASAKSDYYKAYMHVCGELAYYTGIPAMHEHYDKLRRAYCDSLLAYADPESEDALLQRETLLLNEERYDEALAINDRRMAKVQPGSHEHAIVCYYRHLIYNAKNDKEQAKYWLAQSALGDIRNAIMDQAALIGLSEQLNAEGQYAQSYRYIQFTWDCNSRFNTRMRSWQINPILTVIEKNYERELTRRRNILTGTITGISILALLLAAALLYSWRERQQLRRARMEQERSNQQLKQLNQQLESKTQALSELNSQHATLISQLSALNGQLSEANQVKEEYIGRFMSLCSQYVNKLDDYRKMVNRKMKNRDFDSLFQITKSTELKEKELEELYENFDSVFLHLFPTFIEDFNALLLPEMQIHPKEEYRLTTDMRIFALIRLGIEDSSKIAEFLHKSVNTIYNYRARIKNGAAGNREQFEDAVKTIGRYKIGDNG